MTKLPFMSLCLLFFFYVNAYAQGTKNPEEDKEQVPVQKPTDATSSDALPKKSEGPETTTADSLKNEAEQLDVQAQLKKKEKKPKMAKVVSLGASVGYYSPVDIDSADPVSPVSVSATYHHKDANIYLSQGFSKQFYVDETDDDFKHNDTVFGVSRNFGSFFGVSTSGSLSLSLPTSDFSQRNEILGKASTSFSLSQSHGSFFYSLTPSGSYHVNTYKTSQSSQGAGGTPLPWFRYGLATSLGYTINPRWSVTTSLGLYEVQLERSDRLALAESELTDHPYSFSGITSYKFDYGFSASLGFSQGSILESSGRIDFYLYDVATTQFFASVSYSYSFARKINDKKTNSQVKPDEDSDKTSNPSDKILPGDDAKMKDEIIQKNTSQSRSDNR